MTPELFQRIAKEFEAPEGEAGEAPDGAPLVVLENDAEGLGSANQLMHRELEVKVTSS